MSHTAEAYTLLTCCALSALARASHGWTQDPETPDAISEMQDRGKKRHRVTTCRSGTLRDYSASRQLVADVLLARASLQASYFSALASTLLCTHATRCIQRDAACPRDMDASNIMKSSSFILPLRFVGSGEAGTHHLCALARRAWPVHDRRCMGLPLTSCEARPHVLLLRCGYCFSEC